MYKMNEADVLTPDLILKYIELDKLQGSRLFKLYDYYKGNQDILSRTIADAAKPNNKIVNNYPSYITDSYTGYFMSEPVAYKAGEDAAALLAELKDLFNYNDEQAENAELAKDCSIFGKAYELMYVDSDGEIRFKKIEPFGCIPIYDDTINEDLMYFIRYYEVADIIANTYTTYVEVYTKEISEKYKISGVNLVLITSNPHSFSEVPVVIFKNNAEELSDFERVISLVDAYDKMQSDSVNDFEAFVDAYLALSGMMGTDSEDIMKMKEDRVLLLGDDAKAEWLVKNVNDTYIENLKKRLDDDIHKFSKCPKLTDESFGGNLSGVAIKYKLIGFENVVGIKERFFKKALQRRIELIINILNVMGQNYDYMKIDMVFTRNIPTNAVEAADMVSKLSGIISKETALEQLPFITDTAAEIERINAETPQYSIDYGNDNNA
jgi:SPP1 family phage portal protein